METTIEKIEDHVVVTVQHESLDGQSASDFREEMNSVISEGANVILDLSKVNFVDSSGLGSIVAILKRLRASGGDIKICEVHEPVLSLFELVRLHKLVNIFETRDAALATA